MWPPPDLVALALALSMDAMAVALAMGAAPPARGRRVATGLAAALAFGTAQGLMPLLGLATAGLFANLLAGPAARLGPLVAFLILLVLGIRMIREGTSGTAGDPAQPAVPAVGLNARLVPAALATSIDAAAAGVTLPLFAWPVLASALLIGIVTAALSLLAVAGGAIAGKRLGKQAEVAGGAVLILVGIRILVSGG